MIRAKDYVKRSDFQQDLNEIKNNYTFIYNSMIVTNNDTPRCIYKKIVIVYFSIAIYMDNETNLLFIISKKIYNLKRRSDGNKGLLIDSKPNQKVHRIYLFCNCVYV